jgi:hypothetical protein
MSEFFQWAAFPIIVLVLGAFGLLWDRYHGRAHADSQTKPPAGDSALPTKPLARH